MAKPIDNTRIGGSRSFQRMSILSRYTLFNTEETQRFYAPIRDFWAKYESARYEPSIQALLSVERDAILAVGMEKDLREIGICRRKVIESLSPEGRTDYVDLLLTAASIYQRQKDYLSAERILEKIVLADRGNWHVLKEHAIVQGRQGKVVPALLGFEKAKAALKEYRGKFEVEEWSVWEADVFEAQLRVASVASVRPNLPEDELMKMLEPVFQIPKDFGKTAAPYSKTVEKILNSLSACGVPFPIVARVFRFTNDGEIAIYKYASLRIGEIFLKKGEEAAKEARELVGGALEEGLIFPGTAQDLNVHIAESLAEAKTSNTLDIITRVRSDRVRLQDAVLGERYREALDSIDALGTDKEIEKTAGDLRAEVISLIGEQLEISDKLEEAVLLAIELCEIDEKSREKLEKLFERSLINDSIKMAIFEKLAEIRIKMIGSAQENAREEAEAPEFLEEKKIHDFFFVRLRGIAAVREIFRGLYAPYGEPASMLSCWYELLAEEFPEDPRQKVKLLKKACQEDGQNLSARIELSRNLGAVGKLGESEKINKELLKNSTDPQLELRILCIEIANICVEVEQLFDQKKDRKLIQGKTARAEEILDRMGQLIAGINLTDPDFRSDQLDWRLSLKNLAELYTRNYDYEKALARIEESLKFNPIEKVSVLAKAAILFKQGKFIEALQFLAETRSKGGREIEYDHYFAEALFQLNQYTEALKILIRDLAIEPDHLNLKLAEARVLVVLGSVKEAALMVNQVEAEIGKKPSKRFEPAEWRFLRGSIALIRAEISITGKKRERAQALFREAIEYFSEDYDSEYSEMETRWCFIRALIGWGDNDQALKEGRKVLQKYPHFSHAHQIIIGLLLNKREKREALDHVAWLIENNVYIISKETLANLVILNSSYQEGEFRSRAKSYLHTIKERVEEDNFRKDFKEAIEILKERKIDFDLEEDLSRLLS